MDYGDIFIGTFGTIWRHRRLWLFGLIGQLGVTLGSVIYAGVALGAIRPWIDAVRRMALSGGARSALPAELASLFARLAGGIALFLLLALAGYIINLIMRGATINEAGVAWAGEVTDARRGWRAGSGRALYVFGLDLMWYVPIWAITGIVFIGAVLVWITSIAVLSGGNGSDGSAAGGAAILGFCGLVCCGLAFFVLIAAIWGVFAPLMYQSAIQGRRPLGEAVAEGWRLSRTHFGPMLIFWLLVVLVSAAVGLLATAIRYPLSLAYTGSWMQWAATVAEQAPGNARVFPPLPPINAGLMTAGLLVQAIVSLVLWSFAQTFGLTMYAEVYRRLTGARPAGSGAASPAPDSPPWTPTDAALPNARGAIPTPDPELAVGATRVYDAPAADESGQDSSTIDSAGSELPGIGGGRAGDTPSDLGLTVEETPEPEDDAPVAG